MAPSTSFGFGMIPNEDGEPMVVMLPCCSDHERAVGDWLARQNPYGEANVIEWAAFDDVQAYCKAEFGDVWLYSRSAA